MTLRRLDMKFGALPLHSRFLTDRTGRLPLRALADIRDLLRLFNRKFPQSLFSVFVSGAVQGGTISEYTFWLANRARFSPLEAVEGENFDLLLGIDTHARAAALVIGYGLEHYVTERDLQRALAKSASAFYAEDYVRGIRTCVKFMTNRMRDLVKASEDKSRSRSPLPISAGEY